MEEVLPSSVADAEALAPEELYKKKRGREAEFLEGEGRYVPPATTILVWRLRVVQLCTRSSGTGPCLICISQSGLLLGCPWCCCVEL